MYKRLRLLVFIVLLMFIYIANNAQAAKQLFVNNVATTLASDITSTSQTSMVITSSTGFPTITGSDWFLATLVDSSGNKEIVKVTARTGTTCTIVRGQESTVASTFDASGPTIVSLRLTKGAIERYEAISEFLEGDGTDLELKSDIIPDTDEAYDIGSSSYEINEIFAKDVTVSGDLSVGTFETGEIDTTAGTCVVTYPSGAQTISSGVSTVIHFNTETHDALGEFNTTSYTFTPSYTGRYAVELYSSLTGVVDQTTYSVVITVDSVSKKQVFYAASGTSPQSMTMATVIELSAGEAVQFEAYCATDSFDVGPGPIYTILSIHRIWD